MESKHWSESRTIWFNAIIAALTVLCGSVELLRSVLPDWAFLVVSMFAAGINVWLRTRTSVPLGAKS